LCLRSHSLSLFFGGVRISYVAGRVRRLATARPPVGLMEFNLSERHIMALNALLIAILAYFGALSVKDILALRSSSPALPAIHSNKVVDAPTNLSRSSYQTIVDRDIFNLAPPPAAVAPVVVEDLHLTLIGVSQASKGQPFAIVQDPSGQQSVYRVGEMIPDAGKLLEVAKDHAVVEHGGGRVVINLPNDKPGDSDDSTGGAAEAVPGGGIIPFFNRKPHHR
jgi:type II secretory pathway component PulC